MKTNTIINEQEEEEEVVETLSDIFDSKASINHKHVLNNIQLITIIIKEEEKDVATTKPLSGIQDN